MVAEAQIAAPKQFQRAGSIPIGLRLKCQNLYLNKHFSPKAIAEITGLTTQQVSNLAVRGNWTKLRAARMRRVEKDIASRAASGAGDLAEAIASECDEHTFAALERTGQALASTSEDAAKDAQAFSATARNLVTISRACRETGAQLGNTSGPAVNLFFVSTAHQAERRADAVDVVATALPEAKP